MSVCADTCRCPSTSTLYTFALFSWALLYKLVEGQDSPDDLKARLDALQKERDELDHAFKSQVGRVSALQKKIDTITAPADVSPENEHLKALKEDFPELADYVDKRLEQEMAQRLAPLQQAEHQRYVQQQLAQLDAQHPHWRDTMQKPEFGQWLSAAPQPVQQLAASLNAADYEYLLNSFAASQQAANVNAEHLQQQRQQRLASNVAIPGKRAPQPAAVPDDFDAAFAYYASKR